MFLKAFAPLLLLLYAPLSTSFSVQLPATVEFDLVFPREGGSYVVTDPFPIIIAVQNAVVAYDYGFDFTWSISPIGALNDNPTPLPVAFNDISVISGTNPPSDYSDNPLLIINSSHALLPGSWTFYWSLSLGPTCVAYAGGNFVETSFSNPISNGSFIFDIATEYDFQVPTFTSTCPSAAGVASFTTVETYSVSNGLHTCPVTASTTPSPTPCQATVNDAQASSISQFLNLSVIPSSTSTSSSSTSISSSSSSASSTSSAKPSTSSTLPTQTSSRAAAAGQTNAATMKRSKVDSLFALSLGGAVLIVL
jgi:hypothetical protein